jgi:nickel-dependent lactate racemase
MGKSIELRYGATRIRLPLPADTARLSIQEPRQTVSETVFRNDLEAALKPHTFSNCRVAVVVADKTRLCAYDRYLPVLLKQLEANGANPDKLACYIAYGSHPAQSDADSLSAYGDIFSVHRFVHHDCKDDSLFALLGHTTRGTPIRLRKDILATDFVITFGAISHHYFAGYGGGRKLLFPGLGQREAIYHNHGLFLDRQRRTLASGCQPGRLTGNPLAEDLAEIESCRPADLAIHGILDSRGRVCRLLVGSGSDHFHRACASHARNCEVTVAHGYDMVLASCGGFPKDINFIQAHKAVHHAAAFVNDGGTLIILAQCRDGIGSTTFLPWFDMGWDAAFNQLGQHYQGNGGTALAMMQKTRRIRICMLTDMAAARCRTIGVEKIAAADIAPMVGRHSGSLAAIFNASLLVRRC